MSDSGPQYAAELVVGLRAGNRRALARLLTEAENGSPAGREGLRLLFADTGRAHTVGITGSPGAGKSTVTNMLAKAYRAQDKTVAIVAVDPSSPFTQGAILGDRVRMQDLSGDPGVFVRSLASRGALGGLSHGTLDVVAVLDASGRDVILIETVGAGQDEVEIAGAAQTTVLINTPGMGDDIQAMKAGIMEIADVLCVNKADHPGVDALIGQLRALLSLNVHADWQPPIVPTIATQGEGADALLEAITAHREHLVSTGKLALRERDRFRRQVLAIARAELLAGMLHGPRGEQRLAQILDDVTARHLDPHSAAAAWIDQGLHA
ncbi:MAG: LAO/AO transport system kinase [Chloroflexi bacterium]|jgi:LAO/AO transport system kinase|nr:MAG: LAO/AO transport system kinase [Chloroflexota bacterium]